MVEINKAKSIEDSEIAVFWGIMSSHLPKSFERAALGDSVILTAFKKTYPIIKRYVSVRKIKCPYNLCDGSGKYDEGQCDDFQERECLCVINNKQEYEQC